MKKKVTPRALTTTMYGKSLWFNVSAQKQSIELIVEA
jgi:hypothetical protein